VTSSEPVGAPLTTPLAAEGSDSSPGTLSISSNEDPPDRQGSVVAALIRGLRPKQWMKNVLVVAAPAAAGVLRHGHQVLLTVVAAVLFCVISSGVYLLNDVIDIEADRMHPAKRRRPIASGDLPVGVGLATATALILIGLVAPLAISWQLQVVFGSYAVLQLVYNLWLKQQPVYDLACVAAGFVLRAVAGAEAVRVPVSEWFLIVATFGSLLVVTGKRLAEKHDLGESANRHRPILLDYTATFLRTVLAVAAAGCTLGYCEWALALQTASRHPNDPIWLQLSIAPVLLGLLRYTFLVEGGQGAKPEDLITSDRSLVVLGMAWAALFGVAIYG
jgi:decaprenyl-phosphate phosphoribosyltransferase